LQSGLESELESIKDSNDKKLETLETQLGELTSQVRKNAKLVVKSKQQLLSVLPRLQS
jgi:hypothetical protein